MFATIAAALVLSQAAAPLTALVVTPDGRDLLAASQDGVQILNRESLEATGRIECELANIHDLRFSPAGDRLAIAGGSPGESGVVLIVRWPTGEPLYVVADHTDLVYQVAWSPDGRWWVSAGADGTVRLHDGSSGSHERTFVGHSRGVMAPLWLSDSLVVSAGLDQSLRLWEVDTGRLVRGLDQHMDGVLDLLLQPGGSSDKPPLVVSVGRDRTVRFWQPTLGRMMRFARLESQPTAAAFSPDGRTVWVADQSGNLYAIDPETAAVRIHKSRFSQRVYAMVAAGPEELIVGGEEGRPERIEISSSE